MTSCSINRFVLRGGIIGLLLPILLIILFLVIVNSPKIFWGEDFIFSMLVFSIAFMEIPVVIIGRALNFPIETGKPAFIMCDLNLFGYVFLIIFWGVAWALIGCVFWGISFGLNKYGRTL